MRVTRPSRPLFHLVFELLFFLARMCTQNQAWVEWFKLCCVLFPAAEAWAALRRRDQELLSSLQQTVTASVPNTHSRNGKQN